MKDTLRADILDRGPKAESASRANMLDMNQPASKSRLSRPRRFLLLPEESGDRTSRGPRIRRYQLTSVGRRLGVDEGDLATALVARELGPLRRM
jgi:hypothetical protein